MSRLTEEEIRAGFALLELDTEDQRARFTRFRNTEPLNGDEELIDDSRVVSLFRQAFPLDRQESRKST